MKTTGINECQETPWGKEFDGKELRGALGGEYDLESRGFAFSCTLEQESTHQLPKHLKMWYSGGFEGSGAFA